MFRKRHTQSLLGQAMSLKRSGGREDMQDLERMREDIGVKGGNLFLRCLVIAAALLTLICAAVALLGS